MAKMESHKRSSVDNLFGLDDHGTHEKFAKKHCEAMHRGIDMEEKRCAHVEDQAQRGLKGKRTRKDD